MQTGKQLRDVGMQRAADAAGLAWNNEALAWVRSVAETSREFTCEQVRAVAVANGFREAPDARAWGLVMTRAARLGWIHKSKWTTSATPGCHACPVMLWRSSLTGARRAKSQAPELPTAPDMLAGAIQ